jgi:uncharacterized membrane protein
MPISHGTDSARAFLLVLWGAACTLIIAAPLLMAVSRPTLASAIYLLFSPVCHQQPDRTFTLFGFALAVCHRCFGIYFGLLAGCLTPSRILANLRTPSLRRAVVLAAGAPLLLDALLPLTGFWSNTAATRFLTGMLFGVMTSGLLVAAFAEIFSNLCSRQISLSPTNAKGGVS